MRLFEESKESTDAGNIPDQTNNYRKIISNIHPDKPVEVKVDKLTKTVLVLNIDDYAMVKVERLPSFPPYVITFNNGKKHCDDFEEVLETLAEEGLLPWSVIEEPEASIAKDFKEYENLWNDEDFHIPTNSATSSGYIIQASKDPAFPPMYYQGKPENSWESKFNFVLDKAKAKVYKSSKEANDDAKDLKADKDIMSLFSVISVIDVLQN